MVKYTYYKVAVLIILKYTVGGGLGRAGVGNGGKMGTTAIEHQYKKFKERISKEVYSSVVSSTFCRATNRLLLPCKTEISSH